MWTHWEGDSLPWRAKCRLQAAGHLHHATGGLGYHQAGNIRTVEASVSLTPARIKPSLVRFYVYSTHPGLIDIWP